MFVSSDHHHRSVVVPRSSSLEMIRQLDAVARLVLLGQENKMVSQIGTVVDKFVNRLAVCCT